MATTSLARTMRRKPEARAAILAAPSGYQSAFAGMPKAATSLSANLDWIQVFVRTQAELKKIAPRAARSLSPQGLLWISFPKGSSGIQTDLSRDRGWDSLGSLDLKWVNLISVDETWSAFALRPYKPGEARGQAWR